MIQLRCDDLDATFDKIAVSPGVEVLQEPADQFWGVRDFAVRDPSGNMVRVDQPPAGTSILRTPTFLQPAASPSIVHLPCRCPRS